MQINDSAIWSKVLLITKTIYWVWLGTCFLLWFCEVLVLEGYVVEATFLNALDFYLYQLVSTVLMPVIFIIISIVRRRVSLWEVLAIALTLSLMFYFISNFHT